MARCVLAVALAAAALAAMDELPARFHLSPELDGAWLQAGLLVLGCREGGPPKNVERTCRPLPCRPVQGGRHRLAMADQWLSGTSRRDHRKFTGRFLVR